VVELAARDEKCVSLRFHSIPQLNPPLT
jgi:hypothetical protein